MIHFPNTVIVSLDREAHGTVLMLNFGKIFFNYGSLNIFTA